MAPPMPIPESTSAETFGRYVGSTTVRAGRGQAWRELKAWIHLNPRRNGPILLPAVSEPFLAWTISGDVEFQEREGDGPWITHRLRRGSMFLTSGGAPYECRWQVLGEERFESLAVFLELPLLQRALAEVHGADAPRMRLRDLSAFTDAALDPLLERLREELLRRQASPLLVQGLGQAIAVHLARHYAELPRDPATASPALPGFKLRQITEWMAAHLADEFDLERLAAQAGLSKFHFTRVFKAATGRSPSRFQLDLRLDAARRLLRETSRSIVAIALEVGYANPSRFAQLFRRETGQTPSDYRRRR